MGVVGNCRHFLEGTGEDVEIMGDEVRGGKGRLCKVRVAKFYGIGKQRGLGGAVHDVKSAVVVKCGADVEAIRSSKVPRLASVGVVVDEDFASIGAKWCVVVSMGVVEVLPGGDGRIECGLVE